MSTSQRQDGGLFYANALTRLFEHIAQIVSGHEALVERHYGAGSMTKVIERIYRESDVQASLILETWTEERRVGRKLMEVKSYPFNFLVQSFMPSQRPNTPRTGSPAPTSSHPNRVSQDDDGGVDVKDIDAMGNIIYKDSSRPTRNYWGYSLDKVDMRREMGKQFQDRTVGYADVPIPRRPAQIDADMERARRMAAERGRDVGRGRGGGYPGGGGGGWRGGGGSHRDMEHSYHRGGRGGGGSKNRGHFEPMYGPRGGRGRGY